MTLRYDKTCIFVSWVEPFHELEARPTSASDSRSSGSCLGTTLTSSPLEESLIGTPSFYYEAVDSTTDDLYYLMLREANTHTTLLTLESTFAD